MSKTKEELNTTQEEIVEYLEEHEVSSLGEIARSLKLSSDKALDNVQQLKGKGVVDNTKNPPLYNLNTR
ncbi:MAG: winged helix-turn-helix transcriptional regulator [Bacteroidota bacterium]